MPTKSADYQKGYAAGRRRVSREDSEAYMSAKRQEFRNQAALAVLPQLMAGSWTMDGKRVSTIEGYTELAGRFGNQLADRAVFYADREFRS